MLLLWPWFALDADELFYIGDVCIIDKADEYPLAVVQLSGIVDHLHYGGAYLIGLLRYLFPMTKGSRSMLDTLRC